MKEISKIREIPNFEGFPNGARGLILAKFNEIIEVVNQQSKEIERLKNILNDRN